MTAHDIPIFHTASIEAMRRQSAQAERDAFARGAAQDAARWQLAAQIALTRDARASFLAQGGDGFVVRGGEVRGGDEPRTTNPEPILAFHDALGEEMRLRREYFDAFGTPYDDDEKEG